MKRTILLSAGCASLLFLAACSSDTASVLPDDSSSSSSMEADREGMNHSEEAMEATSSAAEASADVSVSVDTTDARVIEMTAEDWKFTPATIMAKKGKKVVVRLTGTTGEHSFAIPDLNISIKINPGETKDITIPTDKAGTYGFRCMTPCGPGHKDMKGTLTVE